MVVLFASVAQALITTSPLRFSRTRTITMENFGFDFAEDQSKNTPIEVLGERRLKTEFIASYKPTATVLEGTPYPLFQEVQSKKLLSKTTEAGLLGALDDLGLSLSDIEKLLPVIEKSGLLKFVAKNLPLVVILTGYLLVEPAPVLIPALGAALKVPPSVYAVAALGSAGIESLIVLTDSSDLAPLGFILVPVALLAAILAGLPLAIDAVSRLPPPAAAE
ncbi:hypothetical protein CTAYLR_002021 [Chrysophaeum taylorii]|uniref:Uncharacterized protein n=1 Tax=Chrysophaeum taylorii TaxID=2483200 RepID=A0AAD7UP55_9STRA|nr:hypothetical protein CTAYLR_002021 [Chrysophaeum taylorii]